MSGKFARVFDISQSNAIKTNITKCHLIRFHRDFDEQTFKFQCHGSIVNKNKLEDFKQCDKKALITEEGQLIADDILSGRWLKKPSLLARFFILSYAVSANKKTSLGKVEINYGILYAICRI